MEAYVTSCLPNGGFITLLSSSSSGSLTFSQEEPAEAHGTVADYFSFIAIAALSPLESRPQEHGE